MYFNYFDEETIVVRADLVSLFRPTPAIVILTVLQIRAVSWDEIGDGEAVDICFETREIKGEAFFPPEFCLSETVGVLPVTGGPVVDDGFLFRVTAVGN